MQSRVSEAVRRFESGYSCAQAVFSTYADLFGMSEKEALKISGPFGGGMGRMREVCGTVSAMTMLVGLAEGDVDPTDREARTRIYTKVREMSDAFKEDQGSIICRELLGIRAREKSAEPSERTPEYYMTRPCSKSVMSAAQTIEQYLLTDRMED